MAFAGREDLCKLYKMETVVVNWSFWVSLPVDPDLRLPSEIATRAFLRPVTTIPMLHVIAYDASQNNILGHELALPEFVPGQCLESQWR